MINSQYITKLSLPEKRSVLTQLLQKEALKPDVFALSFAQQRLWLLEQLNPGTATYNIPLAVRLKGQLNCLVLQQCFNEVVRRHESLRTTFRVVNEEPVQEIEPSYSLTIPIVDLREISQMAREEEAQRLVFEEVQKLFDLSKLPLLRVKVLRIEETEHILLVTMHHIISDAWSIGILLEEIATLYAAFLNEKESQLSAIKIQYADFAIWQRNRLSREVLESQISYWKQQLADLPTLIKLPCDRPRPAVQNYRGAIQSLKIDKDLAEGISLLSQREGVTLFMTLLAAFKTLLYCYINQEDIVVGSPIANRNRSEIEKIIGFFVNTLILRTNLSGNPSFRELLERVREMALGAFAHQELPVEKILEELQPERNSSYNPLFQVWFVLQNSPLQALEFPGLTFSAMEVNNGMARHDLKLEIVETPTGIQGYFEYKTALFDATTITRMAGYYQKLLHEIVAQPDIKISQLAQIVTAAEKQHQFGREKQLQATGLQKLKMTQRKAIR
ncbi:condensation domain-containing protein [Kamptonema animale CS-326]|jgi:hypothetical protein|uniref:condensation domain-containing protein n=1 Tax=Kamptonema animale TaxID=92934 RepID=UPI00232B62A8|nr:condensation domain-containing protein [Kamptonema animale]MDB9510450.1 condensation domain-containing protein [Kamptonema animale CS-326]